MFLVHSRYLIHLGADNFNRNLRNRRQNNRRGDQQGRCAAIMVKTQKLPDLREHSRRRYSANRVIADLICEVLYRFIEE